MLAVCDAFTISDNKKQNSQLSDLQNSLQIRGQSSLNVFWLCSTLKYGHISLELKVSESFASLIHYRQCWQFVTLLQLAITKSKIYNNQINKTVPK
jgi:hypothetical protein